jgi:hypothetical protein
MTWYFRTDVPMMGHTMFRINNVFNISPLVELAKVKVVDIWFEDESTETILFTIPRSLTMPNWSLWEDVRQRKDLHREFLLIKLGAVKVE